MTAFLPRVSVILPFYRAGKYLREAIESVLDQHDFNDWHLYLVNDHSDDCDVEIARGFHCAQPGKITFLQHEGGRRLGTGAVRNLAIRRSQSELVAFLDADDTWYPHKLAFQVALLEQQPTADMLYGPALRWNSWKGEADVDVPAVVDGYGSDCIVPGAALLATFLRDEALTPCTGSVLIRRSALLRVGCFEEQFSGLYDDQVLYAKLCASSKILVSSNCVSRYRQHSQSCCRQAESENTGMAERRRFLEWLRTYREIAVA